ncbi:MAG: penicillin-binding transpeptidase domain-containing protein, partial [Bryobacteraceae bacterium]
AIGGLALGGKWYRPHLVKGSGRPDAPKEWGLNPANVARVVAGMYGVVNEGGTGGRARLPGIDVCGKTGTAQLASNEFLKANKQSKLMKDNAWFVGFAGRSNPEIVVAALFENGEHGPMAAPIVRDIIKVYYDKKARVGRPAAPSVFRAPAPDRGPVSQVLP